MLKACPERLTNIEGFQTENADLSITIKRPDLEKTMMGVIPLIKQIETGTAKVKGDTGILKQLAGMMVRFDLGFEVLPGTAAKPAPKDALPFKQDDFGDTSGG